MAIHIASWRGNVNAVKRFIQQCGVSINVPGAVSWLDLCVLI